MRLVEELDLNGTWELQDQALGFDLSQAHTLFVRDEGWIPTPVPGDIHQGLISAGRITEPLVGLNSFDCRWTEERSWWYRKTFDCPARWRQAERVELELDDLDSNAEVFLNGHHIGSHRSAFYPFVQDIGPWLAKGDNTLLVRLTAGVETVSELDLDAPDGIRASTEAGRGRPERGEPRRTLVRKPQYSFGWDWGPRVATTAIAGNARIRAMNGACIRDIALCPQQGGRVIQITATVDRFHYYKTAPGAITVTLTDAQGRVYAAEQETLLRSGLNYISLSLFIEDPQFWWPNDLGPQHLYRVSAQLEIEGGSTACPPFDWGLRTIALSTQDQFAVVVNGAKVFAKGANWIPADAIYGRVTAERYDALIREARDARFNMLRIWGGGRYEDEAFYQACDRYGIMIWHDFMFACAPYPDHLGWFCEEVRREADYQTRRLRRHACLALWCGNNENNWGFRDWWQERTRRGAWTYNYALPRAVQTNCPEIPYWNGSPYGGTEPNSSDVGDRHHWHDCMMNPDMEKRITPQEYDKCTSLFVSEFGYVGACGRDTLLAYMDGASLDRRGTVWQHHTNTFEKDTVAAGIAKHYLPGLQDVEDLDLDAYLLYSGLCQGQMLAYALESMRYRERCYGSLFWMYNDCWGEVGWTIVDYCLRRKPSWYYVRRAYAPQRIILRPVGENSICAILANDAARSITLDLEVGYVSLDGRYADLEPLSVRAEPLSRTTLCTFARGEHDPTRGLWIARTIEPSRILPAIYYAVEHHQLEAVEPRLSLSVCQAENGPTTARISAQAYAHAVHLRLPDGARAEDDYFDLLPGETREVRITCSGAVDPDAIAVTSL